ncbi:MAG: prephenate dehydrogenase/arogenate dehydrogenase family protein [Bacteroidales bacterium]|nr:prephenate dehydrogenase/arogenate dehydrogenase family protein [Bacteroidales bacterium]
MEKKTVSVYGFGRFGKFWANLLADDFNIKVYSRRGLKPEEVPVNMQIVDEEGIFDCDALFFCVAISAFEDVLKNAKDKYKPGTLFFDTCSVKVNPTKWMVTHLPENSPIIATHPMFGPDSFSVSKDPLPIVMCNINAEKQIFKNWVNYFSEKFMRVEIMTPEKHDEMVAYSQGVTHYIGRVLADLSLKPTKINTLGYVKILEIIQQTCNDSLQLFVDLQRYNPYTKKMREELHQSLEKIYSYLKDNGLE